MPREQRLRRALGAGTHAGAATLTGLPALTMPGGLVSGPPVGVQLIARRRREGVLLSIASAMQPPGGSPSLYLAFSRR